MNKFVKYAVIVIGVIIVILGGFYVKDFIIGSKSYESINIDKVTVSSSDVLITGNISDTSSAYKDFSYTLVGTELYVTIKTVKLSSKYNEGKFEVSVPVNGLEVYNIHLTDDKSTKVIYSKGQ